MNFGVVSSIYRPSTLYGGPTTLSRIKEAVEVLFLRWPMWVTSPSILLATGMVPMLRIPLSSVFLGPNMASLLSLVWLDCIFNLGATLFLLMADSSAQPSSGPQIRKSEAQSSYRFWNMLASFAGFLIPAIVLFGSRKGILRPQLHYIPAAIRLGPYALLLFVQVLTEALTWHWRSTVWLVMPVVYEVYSVLQLMRGLKLGSEVNAPDWMLNMIKGSGLLVGSRSWGAVHAGGLVRQHRGPNSSTTISLEWLGLRLKNVGEVVLSGYTVFGYRIHKLYNAR